MRYKKFEMPPGDTLGKSWNELMAECLKLGLPVRKDDSSKTLQLFLDLTYEKNSLFIDDEFTAEKRSDDNFFIKKIIDKIYEGIKLLF